MGVMYLESGLGLDLLDHGVGQRLVKLRERGKSTITVMWGTGLRTCWRTFMAN